MQVSDFTYDLPENLIANEPPKVRGEARLLVIEREHKSLTDAKYPDVADMLAPGDLLIVNDTRVIKARLIAENAGQAKRELIILEKHGEADDWQRHKVIYRGRLKTGELLRIGNVELLVEEILGNGVAVVKSSQDLLEVADKFGQVPLPPYMHRDAKPSDVERYQTVWAEQTGSVAAPTASLNMTNELLDKLRNKGVDVAYITLHVGLGTFLPIRSDNIEEHVMHEEYFNIPLQTVKKIQSTKSNGHRVVALGTTVARTLEHAHASLKAEPKKISGEADIFIYPGYQFQIIDGLLTNFHAPKSTVLMLTAAFAGWPLLHSSYLHAVNAHYRFLSYGDSMLIL